MARCEVGCTCDRHGGQPALLYSITGGYKILDSQHDHPAATIDGRLGEHRKVLYEKIGDGPHPCHWMDVYHCGRDSLVWGGRGDAVLCVDHLDEDRLNNDPENLVSSCISCNFRRSRRNSLTAEKVLEIRAMRAAGGMNNIQIAAVFGLTQGTVWKIVNNKIWKNVRSEQVRTQR